MVCFLRGAIERDGQERKKEMSMFQLGDKKMLLFKSSFPLTSLLQSHF
jgi:hypothetical protein